MFTRFNNKLLLQLKRDSKAKLFLAEERRPTDLERAVVKIYILKDKIEHTE